MSEQNEGPSPLMRMMINNHIHQHDVSALKSEVERLRAIIESNLNVCKKMVSQSDAFRIERDVLKAENERLRSKLNFSQSISETCKQLYEGETITVQGAISSGKTILSCPCQCEQLTAENERLRKAGDELLGNYYATLSDVSDFEKLPSVAQWLAAKEGRDAK